MLSEHSPVHLDIVSYFLLDKYEHMLFSSGGDRDESVLSTLLEHHEDPWSDFLL